MDLLGDNTALTGRIEHQVVELGTDDAVLVLVPHLVVGLAFLPLPHDDPRPGRHVVLLHVQHLPVQVADDVEVARVAGTEGMFVNAEDDGDSVFISKSVSPDSRNSRCVRTTE